MPMKLHKMKRLAAESRGHMVRYAQFARTIGDVWSEEGFTRMVCGQIKASRKCASNAPGRRCGMTRAATISACTRYRYSLRRTWAEGCAIVCFIMLNPSTADADIDDPTIRRCIGFGKSWNFD